MTRLKILFIGGTGNISLACSIRLLDLGHDLWLLNRTGPHPEIQRANYIPGDIHNLAAATTDIEQHHWDVIVNWIGFTSSDAKHHIDLFKDKTKQYIFISSASCYENPGPTTIITQESPLANPFWQYSRDKIAAERCFMLAYEQHQFPITIVRPSHTYSRVIPLTIGGWTEYTAVARMKLGKPVVVQGDGHSLWTLTHAEDFAVGFCGLLGNMSAVGEAFHMTGDQLLTWNQIYQQTALAAGVEAKIVHVTSDKICQLNPEYTGTLLGDKSVSAIFDNSKIKKFVPEFKQTIPYDVGIKRVLDWFDNNPEHKLIDLDTDAFIERLVAIA